MIAQVCFNQKHLVKCTCPELSGRLFS